LLGPRRGDKKQHEFGGKQRGVVTGGRAGFGVAEQRRGDCRAPPQADWHWASWAAASVVMGVLHTT